MLACAHPAIAQDQKFDVAVGYAWEDDHGFHYPLGLTTAATVSVAPWLGIVGEVDGNYHRDHIPDIEGFTYRGHAYTVSLHTFAVGPRVSKATSRSVAVFGQTLVGTNRIAGVPVQPFGWSQWSLLMQPGGGVSIKAFGSGDIRLTVEFPLIRVETFIDKGETFEIGHEFHRMTRVGVAFARRFGTRH